MGNRRALEHTYSRLRKLRVPKFLVSAALAVLAVATGVTAHYLLPDAVNIAQAHNGHIIVEHQTLNDDIGDGYGHSHRSRVWYTRHLNPFVADVDWVKYGGRQSDSGTCFTLEWWRHEKTKYKEWTNNSWVEVVAHGAGSWRTAPDDHSISYPHNFTQDVSLEGGGLVSNQLKYHRVFTCGNNNEPWVDNSFTGRVERHWLE